ncbi:MAG: DMT family transporter [Thermoguttaceae bacterium]|nr:DMT family transporter [Thermoguttaceae bacterium]
MSSSDQQAPQTRAIQKRWKPETVGFCEALASAVFYTISLSSMRGLTNYDVSPLWSLGVKELVSVCCVMPVIIVMALRGKYRFRWGAFWALVAAGASCEIVGSIPHLWAYAAIGLALATPLVLAAQLICSSIVGAVWLKERVTRSKIVALVLLVVAVFLLSGNGSDAEIAGKETRLALGLFFCLCTAIGYAGQLAIMRRVLRDDSDEEAMKKPGYVRTPTTLVMVTVTGVGVVVCGILLTAQKGPGVWLEPPIECWRIVVMAGIANMCGFYLQIESLRRLYVLKQTLIASAQAAALCLVGVLLFGETFGILTALGVALVLAGVIVSGFSK